MSASSNQTAFLWFRVGDLRLTDHEPLHQAISSATNIIPFFCLDDRLLQPPSDSLLNLPATGPYRLAAILEAVDSLKKSLEELGSDLITSTGNTADALEHLLNTAATAASGEAPSTHVSLYYYPCLLDFNGKLGSDVEKEITDRFLQLSAAQGLSASLQPCTSGGGGGTSLLYVPEAIHSVHTSDINESILDTAVELLEQTSSMTDFRKLIQSTTPVRRPLPPPPAATTTPTAATTTTTLGAMPPVPVGFSSALQNSSNKKDGVIIKSLERIAEGDSVAWKEYYKTAGAADALKNLEDLVLVDGGDGDDSSSSTSSFSPALVDEKIIHDRVVKVQRPPITEKEVEERLRRLFSSTSGDGEAASLQIPLMDSYRESRMTASNGLETSAMLSLALSLGTLSVRTLYWKTLDSMLELLVENGKDKKFNKDFSAPLEEWCWSEPTKESPGHHWLLMHFGIRDFFTYYAIKSAQTTLNLRSCDASGPQKRKALVWSTDQDILSSWAQGQTGFPFVDASMRELAHTGWCSNRGRQNVASFLSKSLQMDWRLGEEIFSSLLLDHDVAVNWASWAYIAGVGADPRDRVFKTVTQGEKYDPLGEYIVQWVPEVSVVSSIAGEEGETNSLLARHFHRPWEREDEAKPHGTYPKPIIDPSSQIGKGPPPHPPPPPHHHHKKP
jgi:deoxyribodipyrimidine photolyase